MTHYSDDKECSFSTVIYVNKIKNTKYHTVWEHSKSDQTDHRNRQNTILSENIQNLIKQIIEIDKIDTQYTHIHVHDR